MPNHVHVGAINALVFLAYYLIIATILRMIMIKWPDSSVGKALAFIHG